MTMGECPHCGKLSPVDAWLCSHCRRAMRPLTPPPLDWKPGMSSVTTQLVPVEAPQPVVNQRWSARHKDIHATLTAAVGLLFAILFTMLVAEFLQTGGLPAFGLWPMIVLVPGALLAQEAWVKGELLRGIRGMGLWGGMTWLLATNHILPWAIVLLGAWFALLRLPFRRQS